MNRYNCGTCGGISESPWSSIPFRSLTTTLVRMNVATCCNNVWDLNNRNMSVIQRFGFINSKFTSTSTSTSHDNENIIFSSIRAKAVTIMDHVFQSGVLRCVFHAFLYLPSHFKWKRTIETQGVKETRTNSLILSSSLTNMSLIMMTRDVTQVTSSCESMYGSCALPVGNRYFIVDTILQRV